MKKILFTIVLSGMISLSFGQEWQQTWAEEFDYQGLPNDKIWNYFEGMAYNNESQFYRAKNLKNSRVEDGMLILEAFKENHEGAKYTSGRIMTKGKKEFLYGRIEVKAKLPTGKGMWPAIWMLGINIDDVPWPACGEIDIMENVGFEPDIIHGNVHTKAYNHSIGTNKGSRIKVSSPYQQFYVYAIEWFEDHIDFYVDGQKYFTFNNERKSSAEWPFDKPHYLILNVAVGGFWGGEKGIDDSIFPQQMLVDYVRYYELK